MSLFPVSIKLKNTKCLVIGGGSVAERKVKSLLNARAEVTVISPDLSDHLSALYYNNRIKWINREYRKNDIKDHFIVIAATNNKEVNNIIYHEAKEKRVLINCADDPDNCNFFMPAIIQRGDMQFTISSEGKVPYLTKELKEYFEKIFYTDLKNDIDDLYKKRKKVIEECKGDQDLKKKKFEEILKPEVDNIINKLIY